MQNDGWTYSGLRQRSIPRLENRETWGTRLHAVRSFNGHRFFITNALCAPSQTPSGPFAKMEIDLVKADVCRSPRRRP